MNKEQDREKGLSGQAFASLKNEMQKKLKTRRLRNDIWFMVSDQLFLHGL